MYRSLRRLSRANVPARLAVACRRMPNARPLPRARHRLRIPIPGHEPLGLGGRCLRGVRAGLGTWGGWELRLGRLGLASLIGGRVRDVAVERSILPIKVVMKAVGGLRAKGGDSKSKAGLCHATARGGIEWPGTVVVL